MIIKKQGSTNDKLKQAAYDLALMLKLTITENSHSFTIAEALDEEHWFKVSEFNADHFEEFIHMCEQYSTKELGDVFEEQDVLIKVPCPRCTSSYMTSEQIVKNTIETQSVTLVGCINCGELMNLRI